MVIESKDDYPSDRRQVGDWVDRDVQWVRRAEVDGGTRPGKTSWLRSGT
jgi:hypothetical protein